VIYPLFKLPIYFPDSVSLYLPSTFHWITVRIIKTSTPPSAPNIIWAFQISEFELRCLFSIDLKSSLKKRNRPNGGLKGTFVTLVSSPPFWTNTPAAERIASNTGVAVTTTSTLLTKCSLLADWKVKARTWRKEWNIFPTSFSGLKTLRALHNFNSRSGQRVETENLWFIWLKSNQCKNDFVKKW